MQASHHDQPYVDEMHMQAAMKRGCQSPWTAADYIEDGHLIQLAWGACVLLQQKVKRALSVWNGRSHHLLEVSFIQNLSGILRFSALYKFGGIYVWDWCHQQLCGEPKKSVVSCRQFVCRRVGEIAIFAEDGLVSRVSSCSSHHEDLPYIAPIWSDNGKSDSNEDVQNLFFCTDHIKDFIEKSWIQFSQYFRGQIQLTESDLWRNLSDTRSASYCYLR